MKQTKTHMATDIDATSANEDEHPELKEYKNKMLKIFKGVNLSNGGKQGHTSTQNKMPNLTAQRENIAKRASPTSLS